MYKIIEYIINNYIVSKNSKNKIINRIPARPSVRITPFAFYSSSRLYQASLLHYMSLTSYLRSQ